MMNNLTMTPTDTKSENELPPQAGNSNDTAPDSETQSSVASSQGQHNNPELRKEFTGGTTTNDEAEGPREEDM